MSTGSLKLLCSYLGRALSAYLGGEISTALEKQHPPENTDTSVSRNTSLCRQYARKRPHSAIRSVITTMESLWDTLTWIRDGPLLCIAEERVFKNIVASRSRRPEGARAAYNVCL